MILHASVPADDPERTATLLAHLFGGRALPFGPGDGSWTAVGQDPIGNVVTVLQRGSEFHPRDGEEVETRNGPAVRHSAFHLLVETGLTEEKVLALAQEGGCRAQRATHGMFDVIEFWIDDCLLIEVATPELAEDYRKAAVSPELRDRLAPIIAAGNRTRA
jgi:hypothetical protein